MATVLDKIERCSWGAPSEEEKEHDKIGREHFNKYCSHCPTASDTNSSWHEGTCTECSKNPYIMEKS